MKFNVIFLPCLDLEATTTFYTEILDYTLFEDQGSVRLFKNNEGMLGFSQAKEIANGICISMNLDSIEAVLEKYEYLEEKKVAGLTLPTHHPKFPVYSFYFKDPNGYTLEYQILDSLLEKAEVN